jgi:hypothetical protein
MAGEKQDDESVEGFIAGLKDIALDFAAAGEVSSPVLHFIKNDGTLGVMPLMPLPDLDSAEMARLVVGYYDPPVAAVLAEGWSTTKLNLPPEVAEALNGKRPWSEVSAQVAERVAPALKTNKALAQALERGDVPALKRMHVALVYAWHRIDPNNKPVSSLPAHMRQKVLCLFGEDRDGNSQTLLWTIENKGGKRRFTTFSLEGAEHYATRWRPLYLSAEMAASTGLPMVLVRPRVSEMCQERLRPYRMVEGLGFMGALAFPFRDGLTPPRKH